jgi:tetrapyrrole methylase family protein/MazG family protein
MSTGIIIIGLGLGGSEYWTRAAYQWLCQASEVYLRTAHHPSVQDISGQIYTFDDWYEQQDDLDQIDRKIAAEIVRLGQREQGVIYAVPGHPHVGEATVLHIQAQAKINQLPVTVIPGLSFIEPTLTSLNIDAGDNLQIADAIQIAARRHPPLEPSRPALIAHVHAQNLALRVKKTLLNAYPDNFVVTLVQAAGTEQERVWSCPLSQLDTQPQLDLLTTLYLPACTMHGGFSNFQATIARLRAPDGCPWDRVQTHQSLRPYLLEETHEVLEALDADNPIALAEELGDLLLQILLHTQIAIDNGEFKMSDVIEQINRKMLRRHPHVFGDVVISSLEALTTTWEAVKKAEKAEKGHPTSTHSALDGIPKALPALAQAMTISKKAVQAGFEWPDIEGVLEKVIEEAQEIAAATEPAQIESEIGDLLFSIVNLARWKKIDPESALRATNARFSRRFKKMEQLANNQGKSFPDLTIEEMESVWEEAKRDE